MRFVRRGVSGISREKEAKGLSSPKNFPLMSAMKLLKMPQDRAIDLQVKTD